MVDKLVVTKIQQAAAQARVDIDLAHGRVTPAHVLRIARAEVRRAPSRSLKKDREGSEQPAQ